MRDACASEKYPRVKERSRVKTKTASKSVEYGDDSKKEEKLEKQASNDGKILPS